MTSGASTDRKKELSQVWNKKSLKTRWIKTAVRSLLAIVELWASHDYHH